jgi:hypothetical protein
MGGRIGRFRGQDDGYRRLGLRSFGHSRSQIPQYLVSLLFATNCFGTQLSSFSFPFSRFPMLLSSFLFSSLGWSM